MKRIFTLLLTAIFMVSTMAVSFADVPNTADDKLGAIEKTVYGEVQTGAMADRISRLEADLEGGNKGAGMMGRIDYLYNYTFDNSISPSLVTQMNALEWSISHEVSMSSVQQRIMELETLVQGRNSSGTIHSRIESLSNFAFGSVTIPLSQVAIPENTLVKVKLVTPINAKNLKVGDAIKYQAAEDVIENGMLLFTNGAPGEGSVTKVSQAKNFGRDAEVNIDFKTLTAVDGREVDMFLGEESKKNMEQLGMAAGASIAGMVVLGPIGIITGAFVNGKNINIPEGTEFYIQTKGESMVYAIPTVTK